MNASAKRSVPGGLCCRRSTPASSAPSALILDSHVTTLVAGALMFWLGSGPVKGFAVTLSIGVLTSLFSAILVTLAVDRHVATRMETEGHPDLTANAK